MRTVPRPRRIVLLVGDENSMVERVLDECHALSFGSQHLKRLHTLAAKWRGRSLALQWLTDRGWQRFTVLSIS